MMRLGVVKNLEGSELMTDFISAMADALAAKLQPSSARKLYDLKAAGEYLGLPPRSVYKLIRDGKIPRVKLSEDARRVLVDVADLNRAIDRAKQVSL